MEETHEGHAGWCRGRGILDPCYHGEHDGHPVTCPCCELDCAICKEDPQLCSSNLAHSMAMCECMAAQEVLHHIRSSTRLLCAFLEACVLDF